MKIAIKKRTKMTTTTEIFNETAKQYEIIHDIVKIGLGAFIGVLGTLTVTILNNKNELRKIEEQYERENKKFRLEKKYEILEETLIYINNFSKEFYLFKNSIYSIKKANKYYNELSTELKNKILENKKNYIHAMNETTIAKRKLKMIGASKIAKLLHQYIEDQNEYRNDILGNRIKINYQKDEEWKNLTKRLSVKSQELTKEINLFFENIK
jgi:N-glycosylase/DNA lyase